MPDNETTQLVLSPKARRAGGALARIMSDTKEAERYAFGEVQGIQARAIGDLVVAYPQLNTDQAVGGLLWLTTFHAELIDAWMYSLMEDHSIEHVTLSIEYLYEVGKRSNADSNLRNEAADLEVTREYVPLLLDLLEAHADLEEEERIRTVDQLSSLVSVLGGFVNLGDHDSPERVADALYEYRHREE